MKPTKKQLADPDWWNKNAPEDATGFVPARKPYRPLWVKEGYYMGADCPMSYWKTNKDDNHHNYVVHRPSTEKCFTYSDICKVRKDTDWILDDTCAAAVLAAGYTNKESKTMTEWNGPDDGLPPVGIECIFEADMRDADWHNELESGAVVKIVAHFTGLKGTPLAAFTFNYDGVIQVEQAVACCFRPLLKSKED